MSAGQRRPAAFPERIVLTGFMGAGKSTVGRILAARLGWRFFDTDALITAQHHTSIAEIFRTRGEAHFRMLESQAIHQALEQPHSVIALGGGAIETAAVRDLLFPARRSADSSPTLTIYLEASLPELLNRCSTPHAAARPLLASLTTPEQETRERETPEQRLLRRQPLYRLAHHTIPTSGQPPEAVVDRIVMLLKAQTQELQGL